MRYRFGSFEADAGTGELRRRGLRVRLHAQPMQILLMLLERPGELVTREEICRALWPEGTFVDYEHGVNTAVNRIREALGDRAASPRFVETLARRGYRFVAPVERVPGGGRPEGGHPAGTPGEGAPAARAGESFGIPAAAATPAASTTPGASTTLGADTTPAASTTPGADTSLGADTTLGATAAQGAARAPRGGRLPGLPATPEDLPQTPRPVAKALFLCLQAMYLAFYVGALANLAEIRDLMAPLPAVAFPLLVGTAAALIPARAFLLCAVLFHAPRLAAQFRQMWPWLAAADLLWSLAPFLLLHHISYGLALAATALLVYSPFAQRSLMLMAGDD